MAFRDDLQTLIQGLLLSYDPLIDLASGSPADVHIVQPLLDRLAVDPYDMDLGAFILDRLTQEFPDLATQEDGSTSDLFVKPANVLFAPFRRELEDVKLGQSTRNAAIMADDQADALGANWFEPRREGSVASTPLRIYFSAPVSVQVTPDKRCYTPSGVSFFPVQSYSLSASQMIFNREGSRYYIDITVECDTAGDIGNVDAGEISNIDGLPSAVAVANPSKVTNGLPRETNEEYLARVEQSLSEKSLVVRRGLSARLLSLFSSVRALQVVGAGDSGMDRDILTGAGEGQVYQAGVATVFGNWALLRPSFVNKGKLGTWAPQAGDTLRFQLHNTSTLWEAVITTAYLPGDSVAGAPTLVGLAISYPMQGAVSGFGLLVRPGMLTISGVPGGQAVLAQGLTTFDLPDNKVHLGGHTDVFLRPTVDTSETLVLSDLADGAPIQAFADASAEVGTNRVTLVQDPSLLGQTLPIIGDILVIESGITTPGTYRILHVGTGVGDSVGQVRVDKIFSSTETGLRARLTRSLSVSLNEPKNPRLPFDAPTSDLSTTVGSNLFRLSTINSQNYGVAVGDTVRLLSGPDTGDFVIQSFDTLLGGKGLVVDRTAGASSANVPYQIFKKGSGVSLPLVRVKGLEVLDATSQTTGITVPYGDAVDIRPPCDLDGAGKAISVFDKQVLIFPDMLGIWDAGGTNPLADTRLNAYGVSIYSPYSQGLLVPNGVARGLTYPAGPVLQGEVDFPSYLWNGRRDTLLAYPTRIDTSIATDAMTSDLAESKIGDTITILDGPAKGSYIVRDIHPFYAWGQTTAARFKGAFIQVDREMPVDPVRTLYNFICATLSSSFGTTWTPGDFTIALLKAVSYLEDSRASAGFYGDLATQLAAALTTLGIESDSVGPMIEALCYSGYQIGPAAVGTLRCYFQDPVSVELDQGDNAAIFQDVTQPNRRVRLWGALPEQIVPEGNSTDDPSAWSRDIVMPSTGGSVPAYLGSGSPFGLRGVQTGDVLEFYEGVNELPTIGPMVGSWLGATEAGSTKITILQQSAAPISAGPLLAGQLLAIDSGPDAGLYHIVKVTTAADPNVAGGLLPTVVEVDRPLTNTSGPIGLPYGRNPLGTLGDIWPCFIYTTGNTYPLTIAGGSNTLKIQNSTDGGLSFSATVYTIANAAYANAGALVTALNTAFGGAYIASVLDGGNDILIQSANPAGSGNGHLRRFYIDSTSTAIGPGKIQLSQGTTTLPTGITIPTDRYQAVAGGEQAIIRGGSKKIYHPALATVQVDDWISLFAVSGPGATGGSTPVLTEGEDAPYLGTFQVTAVGVETDPFFLGQAYVELDRSADFPNNPIRWAYWVAHSPVVSLSAPAETTGGGRELAVDFVRVRFYESAARRTDITIPWTAGVGPITPGAGASQASLELVPTDAVVMNHKAPARVVRPDRFRISSTEMALQREGALYYVDLPVRGYGPGPEMNIQENTAFILSSGAEIDGYLLEVENQVFSFSVQEKVSIRLPRAILPVGATPSQDSKINLAGLSLQVIYDTAPVVAEVQTFLNAPLDRVTAANMLARHFLPAYVFLDGTYSGGSTTDLVAKDIIDYINTLPPGDNVLGVSQILDKIKKRGASSVQLPFTLVALVHGADRRIRGLRSTNAIGLGDVPVFTGVYTQVYFIAGPDESGVSPRPAGEQTYLVRI